MFLNIIINDTSIKNIHINGTILFIDFIISKDVQEVLAKSTTNRPVRDDVEIGENMKPLAEIKTLTEIRQEARKNKDFALADSLRDEIKAKGYTLEDTKDGVVIKKI